MTVVQIKKTDHMALIEFGINDGWDHSYAWAGSKTTRS